MDTFEAFTAGSVDSFHPNHGLVSPIDSNIRGDLIIRLTIDLEGIDADEWTALLKVCHGWFLLF